MAMVDLETKKIIGCKKGSKTWWHEKGHIIFNESEKGIKNSFYMQSFFMVIVLFLVLTLWFPITYLKLTTTIAALSFLYFYLYEEIWCWNFAMEKLNGNR